MKKRVGTCSGLKELFTLGLLRVLHPEPGESLNFFDLIDYCLGTVDGKFVAGFRVDDLDFDGFEKDSIVAAHQYLEKKMHLIGPETVSNSKDLYSKDFRNEGIAECRDGLKSKRRMTEIIIRQKPKNPMKMFTNFRKIQNKIETLRLKNESLFETTYIQ